MAKRPTMPKSDSKIAALFEQLLPTDERIVIRPMFGRKAAFVNGHMFTGTFGTYVFVRLDEPSLVCRTHSSTKPPKATAWLERALHWTSTLPAKDSQKRGTTSGRASRTNAGRSK